MDEGPDSWGFYIKNRGELGGWLLSVYAADRDTLYEEWGDDPEGAYPTQMEILAETEDRVFYATYPSDVQFSEENERRNIPWYHFVLLYLSPDTIS